MTRESAIARTNLLLIAAFVILPVVVLVGSYLFRSGDTIKLPGPINTVMAGYPYADQLRDKVAPTAVLTGVVVDLEPTSNGFKTQSIAYGYRLPDNKKTLLVNIENATGMAYPMLVDDPEHVPFPATAFLPLDLSKISNDVPEALAIAATNDLSKFCDLVPLTGRNVDVRLGCGDKGPEWSVVGDGWDAKGPIADLNIRIDAVNGAVLNHSLQKGVGR